MESATISVCKNKMGRRRKCRLYVLYGEDESEDQCFQLGTGKARLKQLFASRETICSRFTGCCKQDELQCCGLLGCDDTKRGGGNAGTEKLMVCIVGVEWLSQKRKESF